MSHLAVSFSQPSKSVIGIEIHHGARKNVAALRTVRTLINNLITGVVKGYKYKMRYVYAHFPINVNIDKNPETDCYEVEIRNFVGEKLVRRVAMRPGVLAEVSKNTKDELTLTGISLEDVSQSAADIQQICRVRNKDIRKVRRGHDGEALVSRSTADMSSTVLGWPVRFGEGQHRRRCVKIKSAGYGSDVMVSLLLYGTFRSDWGSYICMPSSKVATMERNLS